MQNGHANPEEMLERVRQEVQRRKRGLPSAPSQTASSPELAAPAVPSPQSASATVPAKPSPPPVQNRPRLKRARGALDRAAAKDEASRRWPRFLRGLRRNQEAINSSFIRALTALLESLDWVQQKFANLDGRLTDQNAAIDRHQDHLARLTQQLEGHARQAGAEHAELATQRQQIGEIEHKIDLQARHATEEEQLAARHRHQLVDLERAVADQKLAIAKQEERVTEHRRQIEEQQKQFLDLSYRFIAYQTEVGARFEKWTGQQVASERQLLSLQSFVQEQERQTAGEQRQLAELQSFVDAQHEQNNATTRLLSEQQDQLTALRQRQEQASEQQRQISELNEFVTAQHEQNNATGRLLGEHQNQLTEIRQEAAEQRQFPNQQEQFDQLSTHLTEYQNDACARYHLTIEALEQEKRRVEEIRGRVEELQPGTFPDMGLSPEIDKLRDRINALQASLDIVREHLARPESAETLRVIAPSVSEELKKHETDAFYLAFENQFRGDRELIKDRLRFYVPIIELIRAATGNAAAVDLGCGRGEWLELLREHGWSGIGVDLNLCMVQECQARDLKAESADAIAYLRQLPANSLSLVTGYHIVEHLPFNELFNLFRETFRVLCPGGAAIFETPNPECSHVPNYSFYLDPTHRNPIPKELLCFAARQMGFEGVRIERLQSYFEEGVFQGYLDYAGIFTK